MESRCSQLLADGSLLLTHTSQHCAIIDVVVSYHSTRQINKKQLGLLFDREPGVGVRLGWGPKAFPNRLPDTEADCRMTDLSLRNV